MRDVLYFIYRNKNMEKKSTGVKEKPFQFGHFLNRITNTLTGHAEDLVGHWFASFERGVHGLLQSVLKRLSVFYFVLLGATFLLVGCARVLNQVYGLSGIGEIIIGTVIFALVLVLLMGEKHVSKGK
jgi:hypothetical protein